MKNADMCKCLEGIQRIWKTHEQHVLESQPMSLREVASAEPVEEKLSIIGDCYRDAKGQWHTIATKKTEMLSYIEDCGVGHQVLIGKINEIIDYLNTL